MSGDKPYERAGSFYLGRRREPDAAGEPLLYDARDLLTHAVIVGMTGSGKTGLGIAILEEAALAGVPALVVDPKGDMANLLLQFPELAAEDFEPWIDAADAARAGRDPRAEAERVAQQWREGLASWDQGPERVARLAEAADFAVYTPGSTAGRPLAILASLVAPPAEVRSDAELLAERIDATSAALLALLGIDFDPVQSRESILVANLLQHAWSRGQDLSLEALVTQVQSPPFPRLGVLDLETFYPSKDRARLALALNALLASPSFAAWITGDPLDVQRLLWTEDGRPRVSVISIAHLSDRERVFFVSLLLAEVLAWMRAQSGTSSLRALFYMDEIFGFFPPTAEPPTKRPMLTLLKQARAFGLGCVLATQNPVDLDYKGLANCGTWFLGRLQTERDKLRVLDGLEGALAAGGRSVDRAAIDRILSSLGPRVFFLSNVHADGPVLFQTRWVLSWLRGPMTRAEIRRLAERDALESPDDDQPEEEDAEAILEDDDERAERGAPAEPAPPALEGTQEARDSDRPPLPEGVIERYLPRARVRARDAGAARSAPPARAAERVWRAALAAEVRLHYVRSGSGVDVWRHEILVADLPRTGTAIEWALARAAPAGSSAAWTENAPEALAHAPVTAALGNARTFARWRKDLAEHLYQTRALEQWSCKSESLTSELDESRDAFLERCRAAQRARRDEAIEKLRKRCAPKHAALLERVRQAQNGVERQSEQYREKRTSSWLAAGASLIGAFFGRSVASSARRVESTARAAAGARRERADVERAERDLAAARKRLSDLEVELDSEIAVVEARFAAAEPELTSIVIRPRKSDVDVGEPTVLWRPWRIGPDGELDPAW